MEQFTCPTCSKEYKRESALLKHMDAKHPDDTENYLEVRDNDPIDQIIEEYGELSDEELEKEPTERSDENQRRIDKLKVTIKGCYDAETKHRLECELKDLEKL